MDVAIVILTFAVLALVVRFLSGPLRTRPGVARSEADQLPARGASAGPATEARGASDLQALEAAREAKYREIRDCEMDFRTGKLSREDYEAIDAQLRAEAVEILDRLEEARATDAPPDGAPAS